MPFLCLIQNTGSLRVNCKNLVLPRWFVFWEGLKYAKLASILDAGKDDHECLSLLLPAPEG